MKMHMTLFVLAALLALVAVSPAVADPREVENAEFKEEFGEEFDERVSRSSDVDSRFEFALEHNIPSKASGASFTPRGNVEIVLSATLPKPKVTFSELPNFSSDDTDYLEMLLQKNRHYIVRARSDPADPTSPYVMTSIPMCMLAGTRMRENFAFHLSDTGKLVAIEYLTPYVPPAACAEYKKRDLKNVKFGAFGNVLKAQNGPSPPKQIVPKKERAPQGVKPIKSDEEPTEEVENQSFLRKYWYFVLPLVLFSLFGSDGGAPPPAGGAAPAAGGGGGARRR
uniref:ER membrane protein complex subunit 10 n=1 Tax=Globisporangium ultimum (strain ATCC 200006 / CBS 805.95 / DAOM BR144) TaxID=431595 RepID=K3WWC8_GLOUD